jgi:hypothetical protein
VNLDGGVVLRHLIRVWLHEDQRLPQEEHDLLPEPIASLFPQGLDCLSSYFTSGSGERRDPRLSSSVPRKTVDWIAEYQRVISTPSFCHHEPWLTLLALYGILGDQTDLDSQRRVSAVNQLMDTVYSGKRAGAHAPRFVRLLHAQVEVGLRENLVFRRYLKKSTFANGAYHHYSDRRQTLADKLTRQSASLEGNTMLDALIGGQDETGRRLRVFVEAKFLSDISTSISYLSVRNQIARNLDCAIDLVTVGGSSLDGLNDFWFVLLTPGLFRTKSYGSTISSAVDSFTPSKSRLFCYKMDEYQDPNLLRMDLPHWVGILDDSQWSQICTRIGWMTFEDVANVVCSESLLSPQEIAAYKLFFAERGIF